MATQPRPIAVTTSDDYQHRIEDYLTQGAGPTAPAQRHAAAGNVAGATLDDRIWRAAYYIADVGGSNPVGIANALLELSRELLHASSTPTVEHHPGLRAIAGHLAFLYGQTLGPTETDLAAVRSNAKRLGLI